MASTPLPTSLPLGPAQVLADWTADAAAFGATGTLARPDGTTAPTPGKCFLTNFDGLNHVTCPIPADCGADGAGCKVVTETPVLPVAGGYKWTPTQMLNVPADVAGQICKQQPDGTFWCDFNACQAFQVRNCRAPADGSPGVSCWLSAGSSGPLCPDGQCVPRYPAAPAPAPAGGQ